MKKITTFLILFTIIVSIVFPVQNKVFAADGDGQVVVKTNKTSYYPGDTIEFSLSLSKAPGSGAAGVNLNYSYDTQFMDYVSYDLASTGWTDYLGVKGSSIGAAGATISNGATFARIRFKAKKVGSAVLNISNVVVSDESGDDSSVTYTDSKGTANVVEKPYLTGISVKTPPTKTEYYAGDNFDPNGLVLNLTYSSGNPGTRKWSESGITYKSNTGLTAGQTSVEISYGGKSTTTSITVKPLEVTEISSVSLKDNTKKFKQGGSVEKSDLAVVVKYNSGKTQTLADSDYEIADNTNLNVGTATIKVSYKSFTKTLNVNVDPLEEKGIEIKTNPNKTSYKIGDKFDPTGMEVVIKYEDGSKSAPITDYKVVDGDSLKKGQNKVTIQYKTFEVPVDIEVSEEVIEEPTGIKVTRDANKKEYNAGENFDATGMAVSLVYSDGKLEEIKDFDLKDNTNLKEGQKEVTITYKDKQTGKEFEVKYEITVKSVDKPADVKVTGIKVTTNPKKKNYKVGDKFDSTGMVVVILYSDGTTKEVKDFDIVNGDKLVEGQTEVTVKYGEFTTTVPITVAKNAIKQILNIISNNNDNTVKDSKLPQTGSNVATIVSIIAVISVVGIIALASYSKYKNIK